MGDLVCFERTGFTNVPGCQGEGRFSSDYCYEVTDEPTPSVRLIHVILCVLLLLCVGCLVGEQSVIVTGRCFILVRHLSHHTFYST